MDRFFICALLAALLPAFAAADSASYTCTYDSLTRRVEIVTEPGVSVPCEVHYYKDSEAPGVRQVLWRATNDAEFCEKKAADFVGQLLEWGWSCGQGVPSAAETERSESELLTGEDVEAAEPPGPAPVDDTDVIEPPDLGAPDPDE